MRVGFDSKRAFLNGSGLGNYSRNMVSYLTKYFPGNEYLLFTTERSDRFHFAEDTCCKIIEPHNTFQKTFSSYWRTYYLNRELKKHKLDLYHGLSNEIPHNIHKSPVRSVVTIHDLIFLRFPELYRQLDRNIYHQKFRYACEHADRIIAISEQTKADIVNFFGTDETKIRVVYQGCNPGFYEKASQEEKDKISRKFNLPGRFILSVGTVEERKNTLQIIKTLYEHHLDMPLVLAGRFTPYVDKIKAYLREHKMEKQVVFLHEVETKDLPTLYQMSELFVYPSFFEGFGIPIIEALNSGIPVITTQNGCFSEAGGPESLYVDPQNTAALADAIGHILSDESLKRNMINKGFQYVIRFREDKIAQDLMQVYEEVLQ